MALDTGSHPGSDLAARLVRIRERISRACDRAGRDPAEVLLVGASKTVEPERVRRALEVGVADFGENYVRELRAKHDAVPGARWHFFGALQASSAHHVASLADVVHTAEPGKAVRRFARRAAEAGRTIPTLIEVDFTGRRVGVVPEKVGPFADELARLEGVELVGLMTLHPLPERPEDARPWFVRLRELRDLVRETHPGVRELSMGMSLDYEVAIEEGATIVRIGTALFGERPQ